MNSKLFLAALALPLVFTACSQEEYFENPVQNDIDAKGMEMSFSFVKDIDVESRAAWGDALSFNSTDDKFSLYWLGIDISDNLNGTNALKGQTNAVFKSEDANGSSFTSESLVYEGANVAVYPANLAHYKAEEIKISIDNPQEANTVLKVPYISNKIAILSSERGNPTSEQIPGYNNGVKVSVKQAANVFDITLNLKNHASLIGAPFNLNIEKVELVANTNAFTNVAYLKEGANDPTDKGIVKYLDADDNERNFETITEVIDLKTSASSKTLTSKAITANTDGTYTVRFVVLPTDVPGLTNASAIKVYTNCGTVTLKSNVDAVVQANTTGEGAAAYIATLGDVFKNKAGKLYSIAEMFKDIVTYAVKTTETSKFKGEKVGRVIKRTIEVNMANADLSSCDVDSEAKIMHYVNLYNAIEKEGNMQLNLVMADGETDNIFDITKATVDAVDALHEAAQDQDSSASISLNPGTLKIQLTDGGEVYNIAQLTSNVQYILAADKNWTIGAMPAKASGIVNEGTLTVSKVFESGTQTVKTVVLVNLTNGKEATTSANLIIANGAKANVTMSGNGNIEIKAEATAKLSGTSNGDITNDGTFETLAAFTSNGVFTNNGKFTGSSFTNDGTFYNNYTGGVVSMLQNGATTTGDLDDNALVVPVEGSKTVVTNNYGTIKYVEGALLAETTNHGNVIGVDAHKRYGHVVYTFEGSDSEELNAIFPEYATKLVLTKDFEFNTEFENDADAAASNIARIKAIEVTGGTFKVSKDLKLNFCPLFITGQVTLSGPKTLYSNSRIVVDKTAYLTVFAGKIQGYKKTLLDSSFNDMLYFQNNGIVENFGTIDGITVGVNTWRDNKEVNKNSAWEGNPWNVKH